MKPCIICSNPTNNRNCFNCMSSFFNDGDLFCYNLDNTLTKYIYYDSMKGFIYCDDNKNGKDIILDIKADNFRRLTNIEKYNLFKRVAESIVFY